MADNDPYGVHGAGAFLFNDVTPPFDKFNAKVTDSQFRIDLPLLMLYLDTHQPVWEGFKKLNMISSDGTLNEKGKKIIRPFDANK